MDRFGFYFDGEVQRYIPRILESVDDVLFKPDVHHGKLGEIVKRLTDLNLREIGRSYKVIFLSPVDSPETLKLPYTIRMTR